MRKKIIKVDRRKTYLKVLNETEKHNGLQYQTGLIKDILPFDDDPKRTCVKGRIYFTTPENIPLFSRYGIWIRTVKIPKEAKVIIDPAGDKIGADQVVLGEKFDFGEYFDKWFDADLFDWRYSFYLAKYCSEYFDKWFDADLFNWMDSDFLAQDCSEYFDKWFDADLFDWRYSDFLAKYCSKYFEKWGEGLSKNKQKQEKRL